MPKSAEHLYNEAEYVLALAALDAAGSADERATVLRAKILSRLGRPRESLDVIERYCTESGDVPLLCAIAATAAAQCENFDVVAKWAHRAGNPESIQQSRSEAAWYLAGGYYASGRHDLAKNILPVVFGDASPNGKLRGRILHGLLFARNEKYAEQARVLRFATRRAMGEDVEVGLLATAAHMLCCLTSEMSWIAEPQELQRLYDAVRWPSCLSSSRFQATQSLGWRYALSGDYATAYQLLWTARSIAPTAAFELFARVDLAIFARDAGETHHAQSYFREAVEAARKLDVAKVVGEERLAFIGLAELLAKSDPQAAQGWLDEFDASRARSDRLNAFSHDRRLDAMADHAGGLVLFHMGRGTEAARVLSAAHEVFSDIGYEWRAARSARVLFDVTRDSRWLPHSSEEMRAARSLAKLTPREHEVKDLILRGLTIREIAALLVLSVRTVENHKKHVLSKLGVHSQRELLVSLRSTTK